MRTAVGGVFVTNENERSSKIVISTGTIVPLCASVAALYALQKSMIATPCGPRAVPTGGAGVAAPAVIWIFTTAATRFLAMTGIPSCFLGLELRHFGELELDRGLPAEDVDQHLDLQLVLVDLGDLAVEVGERAGLHPNTLAHLVVELRPLTLGGGTARPLDLF